MKRLAVSNGVLGTASHVVRFLPTAAAIAVLGSAGAFAQNAPAATPAATTTTTTAPAAATPATTTTTTTTPPAAGAAPAAATTTTTSAASAAAPAGAATVSSYTAEQADRGKSAYNDDCAGCHGTTLGGGGEVPALAGKGFREHWFVGSIEPFMTYISTNMPQNDPGSLDPQTYADIGAYLMSRNKVPAGDVEVPGDKAAWANITLPPLE
jgi:mono/diheme cytochrome c family protein